MKPNITIIPNITTPTNPITVHPNNITKPITQPIAPTKPITPIPPIAVQPVYPTQPVSPIQPVAPIQPLNPTQPIAPTQPVAPIQPLTPITINPLPTNCPQNYFYDSASQLCLTCPQ